MNSIAPGFFPSKMTAFGMKNNLEAMNHVQPLGRIGSSQDMAGVVCVFMRERNYIKTVDDTMIHSF